jgi:hypothetical protein
MTNPYNLCISCKTATVQGTSSHGHALSSILQIQHEMLYQIQLFLPSMPDTLIHDDPGYNPSLKQVNGKRIYPPLTSVPSLPSSLTRILILHSRSVVVEGVLTPLVTPTQAAAYKTPNTNTGICKQRNVLIVSFFSSHLRPAGR